MRLSLRFIIPLALTLAALAYAVTPLVDRLTLRWFTRDLDLRASLIANTIEGPLADFASTNDPRAVQRFVENVARDERLYALALCPGTGTPKIASPTLPKQIDCADLDRYATSSGNLIETEEGPLLVSVRRFEIGAGQDARLVLVHDMSFITRRSEETRTYLFWFFAGLAAVVSLITVIIAQWSWRGWVSGLTNAFPAESIQMYQALRNGDLERARRIYRWFMPLLHLDAEHDLVQSIKLAECIMGRGSEFVRPPRLPLYGARRAEVTGLVERARAARPT